MSLHSTQPQIIAVSVISTPYRMDLMSNAMFCDPVENPVPAKNSANPKFLKALRHRGEIELSLEIFWKTYPTSSPTINMQAIMPNDRYAILIFPRMFPKSAVRQIRINSGYILFFISCFGVIGFGLSVHFFANNCVKNTTSITPNR